MYHPLLARLAASQANPMLVGLLTFVTTVAMILSQPGQIA